MKKYFLLIFALSLALLTLVACNSGTNSAETRATTEEALDVVSPSELTLEAIDGRLNFKIVRPDSLSSGDAALEVSQTLVTELSGIFGTTVSIGTDYLKRGSSYDDSTLEILVGLTGYSQSQKWAKECNYGDYIIAAEGNKIVITALSEHCLATAGNVFLSKVRNAYEKDGNTATLSASELDTHNVYDKQLAALPIFDGGEFGSYYDAGNRTASQKTQCDEIIIEKTSAEEYESYLAKLESAGYASAVKNTAGGNLFATYTSEAYMITAGYYSAVKETRLLIEPAYDISALTKKEDYTRVTDSCITVLGTEYPDSTTSSGFISNGLSMLIRLEDGRFVIVDGGFNRSLQADNLIEEMRSQSALYTSTPVIAAWIVTHAHPDHDAVFISQLGRFTSAGIKVEILIANAMSESERQRALNSSSPDFTGNEGYRSALLTAAAENSGADVFKAHVGQKFCLANLEIEVVYTLESYAPNFCNSLNTSSVVTKMTFSDSASGKKTTLLCTGDATGAAMETLNRTFGSYIQCDAVQVCHHGGPTAGNDAGTANAYKTVNASLVIWPLGARWLDYFISTSYNKVLFEQPNYFECYFAGYERDKVTIPLPYVAGETQITVSCAGSCSRPHEYKKGGS